VSALALLVGIFFLYAGWHWKLMHRSWQDLREYRQRAKGYIPALRTARSHHTSVALVFAVVTVAFIAVAVH
jgi:hypothetical protein